MVLLKILSNYLLLTINSRYVVYNDSTLHHVCIFKLKFKISSLNSVIAKGKVAYH